MNSARASGWVEQVADPPARPPEVLERISMTLEERNNWIETLLSRCSNSAQIAEYQERLYQHCMAVLRSKGKDYAPLRLAFEDFEHCANALGIDRKIVVMVFLTKHWKAVESFVRHGHSESEPIEGRFIDIINYFGILAAMIHDESSRETGVQP